jgi:Peptidase A4 family
VPVVATDSTNWSGYDVQGGPFTYANGTFTVPALTTEATCGEDTSEWVGVDGRTNTALLQAGVDESDEDVNGNCLPVGEFAIIPWWEELPSPAILFSGVDVKMGDNVTVTLSNSNGLWNVTLVDNTTGQSAAESFPSYNTSSYSGPADSAEWVTEAPTNSETGQEPLAPYCAPVGSPPACGNPTITYSNLVATGNVTEVEALTLVQDGNAVSTPSTASSLSDLLSNGFSTTYTGP